jgi:hypothetical protein
MKVFKPEALLAVLAAELGVEPDQCELVDYCPIRGPHGECYGVAVKVTK